MELPPACTIHGPLLPRTCTAPKQRPYLYPPRICTVPRQRPNTHLHCAKAAPSTPHEPQPSAALGPARRKLLPVTAVDASVDTSVDAGGEAEVRNLGPARRKLLPVMAVCGRK